MPTIYVYPDGTFTGPFTHEVKPEEVGAAQAVNITANQFRALDTLKQSVGGAPLVFDGTTFALAPVEVKRREDVAAIPTLRAKLEAGTITTAEMRVLLRIVVDRLARVEAFVRIQ